MLLLINLQDCDQDVLLVQDFPPDLREVIPLDLGLSWTYRVTYYDPYPPTEVDTYYVTKNVIAYFDSESVRYFRVAGNVYGQDTTYEYITRDRYVRFFATDYYDYDKPIVPLVLLRTPIKKGASWSWVETDTTNSLLMTITNTDTTVVTPLKSFDRSIRVRLGDFVSCVSGEYFFVPRIGIVKQTLVIGCQTVEWELVNVNLRTSS